jgi:ABC-type antimicrobial peptide transport system permease subunit
MSEPSPRRTMALVIRADGPPAGIVTSVRRIVRELDPSVPIFDVAPMTDVIRASTARLSLTLILMSVAAAITLALAAIGLYGVMAYMVALQTKELGVRIALGADPHRLEIGVTARGLTFVAAGVACGLLLFAAVARFLRAFLYGVSPGDPSTLASAAVLLVVIAGLATWLAARRAARVNPMEAFRSE